LSSEDKLDAGKLDEAQQLLAELESAIGSEPPRSASPRRRSFRPLSAAAPRRSVKPAIGTRAASSPG
jgi:hypothetical protein